MKSWLAASPEIDARLESDPPARVADVGCGQGYSTVAIATAYPRVQVEGYDLDAPSIEDAARLAEESGLDGRVSFSTQDVSDIDRDGVFDLVTIFEAVHDMSRPVEVLSALRDRLAPGGSLLIADERVADEFTAPGDEIERVMYGWSVVHCLPVAMAEQPSAALGTVLRRSTVEALARDAGFATVEVLQIDNDFFRFYRLTG
jgi:2-polyprenyl-3-methyl-5-hydroxy-6-metoxy-1,4-benzoquinol methylase